jgi:hypothetical protein
LPRAHKGLDHNQRLYGKSKKLAGGKKSCTHLVELILAMAPSGNQAAKGGNKHQP